MVVLSPTQVPLAATLGEKTVEAFTVDPNAINKDFLASNSETLGVMSEFLRVYNLGSRVDKLTPKKITEDYINAMADIHYSEKAQFNTAMELRRLIKSKGEYKNEAKIDAYANALDLYKEVGGPIDRNKGDLKEALYDSAYVLNSVMNPYESPSMLLGAGIVALAKKMFPRIGKQAAKKGFQTAASLGLTKEQSKELAKAYSQKVIGQRTKATVVASVAADGTTLGGIDALWQDTMMDMEQQEEYNIYQTGFAAMSAILGGVMAKGTLAESTGISGYNKNFIREAKGSLAREPVDKKAIHDTIENAALTWLEKTNKGQELLHKSENATLTADFMKAIILGNDEIGFEGLLQALQKQNIKFNMSDIGEMTKSKGLADATTQLLLELPSDVKDKLFDAIKQTPIFGEVENDIITFLSKSSSNRDINSSNFDDFIYVIASKTREGGQITNLWSQVSKRNKSNAEYVESQRLAQVELEELEKGKKSPQVLRYIQNVFKRDVVSTWSTTGLNLKGFSIMHGLDVATDAPRAITQMAIYSPQALYYMARGNKAEARKAIVKSFSVIQNTTQKLRNALDPNMTASMFQEYLSLDEKAASSLSKLVAAGIEGGDSAEAMAKRYGFKINKKGKPNIVVRGVEAATNTAQKVAFVNMADVYMKSQASLGHLDSLLRERMGFSLKDLDNPKLFTPKEKLEFFASPEYKKISDDVSDLALETIFSRNYKNDNLYGDTVGQIAGAIEDFGNMGIFGTLFPFGKFYNNTIAFTYNFMGGGYVSAILEVKKTGRLSARGQRKLVLGAIGGGGETVAVAKDALNYAFYSDSDIKEEEVTSFLDTALEKLLNKEVEEAPDLTYVEDNDNADTVRGLVAWNAVAQCVDRDKEKRKLNLPWYQEKMSNGNIIDIKYDFPYSQCAVLGRFKNMKDNDEPITREIKLALAEQFAYGQLTRNLGKFNLTKVIDYMIDEDYGRIVQGIVGSNPLTSTLSGTSRPLSMANELAKYPLGDEAQDLDLNKSENAWMVNSTRYLNNIFKLALGENLPDMMTPAIDKDIARPDYKGTREINESEGFTQSPIDATLGVRKQRPASYTSQMFASVNLEPWGQRIKNMYPKGELMFEELVAPHMDKQAYKLLNNPYFQKADGEKRLAMVKKEILQAQKIAMGEMRAGIGGKEGKRFYNISNILSAKPKDRKEAYLLEGFPEKMSDKKLLSLPISTLINIQSRLPRGVYN